MGKSKRKVKLELGANIGWRLNRPAWTGDDPHSYRHLHDRGEIRKNYFNKSEK